MKRTAAFETLTSVLGQDANAANAVLWSTYKPYQVWYWFSAVGFASLAGILVFSHVSKRWKDSSMLERDERTDRRGATSTCAVTSLVQPRPRSSGDRATASGAVCAGSNPAEGAERFCQ